MSVTRSLTALGQLGRWMEREELDVDALDAGAVRTFLAAHVKDRGRPPTAGVLPLLDYLRAEGEVAAEPAAPVSALESADPLATRLAARRSRAREAAHDVRLLGLARMMRRRVDGGERAGRPA